MFLSQGIRRRNQSKRAIGPPSSIKASIEQKDRNVLIEFALEGQAGVLYQLCVRKGKTTIPTPKFRIIDKTD